MTATPSDDAPSRTPSDAAPSPSAPRPLRLPSAPIRAACIDLDGTLLDTAPDIAAAANAMLVELGRPTLTQAQVASFVGKGSDVLIRRCLAATAPAGAGESEADPARFADARARWQAHYDEINGRFSRIFPGVVEGIQGLREQGILLACITNKPGRFVPPLLEHFGLEQAFAFWIAGDTLPVRKPDPGQLLEAARRFGLEPRAVAMLGDSANDAIAARAAAMPVFLVPYGYNEGRPVEAVDCDGIVDSLAAFARALQSTATPLRRDGA